MTNSTIQDKMKNKIRLWAVAVWIIVWQLGCMALDQEILLVSPVSVAARLFELVQQSSFWSSILFSVGRITLGFFIGFFFGLLLAFVSSRIRLIRELIQPVITVMKSVPVASFVILCLIWISSKNLSVFITFVMVFPIIYTNILEGILTTDKQLLEMAGIFNVTKRKRLRFIYLPHIMPFLRSACSVTLGMCWKAGIAAEVIGIPSGSIGEKLYEAKIYLSTPDLFAWTVVIIVISLIFEKLFLLVLNLIYKRLERV